MLSRDDAALHLDRPEQTAAPLDPLSPDLMSQTPSAQGPPPPDPTPPADPDALAGAVMAALVDMALRSKRRQADLEAALHHARIDISREQALGALDLLATRGWVDTVVPLHDGGVLMSVTGLGLEVAGRQRIT
jgi:hypothetical protein